MSSNFYFFNEEKPKSPFLKIKNKLNYEKWCKVMESYNNITWDIDTKHGLFYLDRYGNSHFKRQVYFDYKENPDEFNYVPGEAITTGTYSFFISFSKEYGYARTQFYGKEKKELIPLFFEISQKLGCFLLKDGRQLITEEDIKHLNKPL